MNENIPSNDNVSGKRKKTASKISFNEKILWCVLIVVAVAGIGLELYFLKGSLHSQPTCVSNFSTLQHTYAPAEEPLKMVVYGDSRTGHDVHRQIVDMIMDEEPDVVFHTGDLVNDGTNEDDWEMWDDITGEMVGSTVFYPAIGNHEKNADAYFDHFELPNNERWYVVKYENIHVFVLDTTQEITMETDQFLWFEQELAESAEDVDGIIVVFHHPPYSTGPHDIDEASLREDVVPLMERYGVDIAFAGHDHSYERSLVNGIYYIVTGGGGAPTYEQEKDAEWSQLFVSQSHYCYLEVEKNTIQMNVYGVDGDIIDEVAVDVRN